MGSWDREKLYIEVWAEPVTKIAARYGVSDVMVAKVCRKLRVPLPGRGYWARIAAGQKLTKTPLPKLKQVPLVYRYKTVDENAARHQHEPPAPEPTDPEYLRVVAVESRTMSVDRFEKRHKLVLAAERRLSGAKVDSDGMLQPNGSGPMLEMRVSPGTLQRALAIMNAIIFTLEAEKFTVSLEGGLHGTKANVFGHAVSFAIVERLEVTGRREVQEYSWSISTKTVVEHRPTGNLELRVDDFTYGPKFRDTKRVKLESIIAQCVGGIMRIGRREVISAEQKRQAEIRERQIERMKLADEIRKEEAKIKELDGWVDSWARANQIRVFVDALETTWNDRGEDLGPESARRKRLDWMRHYADWLDPLVAAPPSVLDRRHEVRYW
jgi:hypothetical protein